MVFYPPVKMRMRCQLVFLVRAKRFFILLCAFKVKKKNVTELNNKAKVLADLFLFSKELKIIHNLYSLTWYQRFTAITASIFWQTFRGVRTLHGTSDCSRNTFLTSDIAVEGKCWARRLWFMEPPSVSGCVGEWDCKVLWVF